MSGYEQILRIKEAAEARLRALPGVHAVGISRKVVGGEPTDELCITVFLVEKKPLDRLAPEEVVPPEIDGVSTDVVEMERPRLLAAPVTNLTVTISADGLSATLGGSDPPGGGLVIVLSYTVSPLGGPAGSPAFVSLETVGAMGLSDIAALLAGQLTRAGGSSFSAAVPAGQPTTVTLTPSAGMTSTLTAPPVLAVDDGRYADDFLRGGIQIAVTKTDGNTEVGTLGCIATTVPTAEDPQGKVVAITCHHVVGPFARQESTNPRADVPRTPGSPAHQINFTGTGPVPRDTLVVVEMILDDSGGLECTASYRTVAGDTVSSVAQNVADAITRLDLIGLTASAAGTTVTVGGADVGCRIYAPPADDFWSDLQASVTGVDIELTGDVQGDDYGIFATVNAGGTAATFSVYYNPLRGSDSTSITVPLADAIRKMAQATNTLAGITPVGAHATGARVTVDNAQEVECTITSNCQVGQPYADFPPKWLPIASSRIGKVFDSRIDVDAAIVQLDAGQKYRPLVQGLGTVAGTYDLKPDDVFSLRVLKQGRTTGTTGGMVGAMNLSGVLEERLYTNAVLVLADAGRPPFSLGGDSGSAVLQAGRLVVGILFGGNSQGGLITPINLILAAFPALQLNLAPPPAAGTDPTAVRIVPEPAKGS